MTETDPTTVMHVIPGLGVGGAESMLTTLVTAARPEPPRQVVVDLLTANESINTERLKHADIPVHQLGMRGVRDFRRTVQRLTALIMEERPNAVQTWMYYADLVGALSLRRSGRLDQTKLYWGVRCSDMDVSRHGLKLRLAIAACRQMAGTPQAIIANSETGRRVHVELGYPAASFQVIPNGIDTARFKPDRNLRRAIRGKLGLKPDATLVVLAARVDPMKDHGSFISMLEKLPDVTGVAVGQGTEALPSRKNLVAPGVWRDMPAMLAAADVLVSTSAYGEGFSNVIGEAMAAGTPVISTDVGDARHIIGDTGVIVAPRDPNALAAGVRSLLDEPEQDKTARSKAVRQRIVEKYSLDRAVAAFDHLHKTDAA